MVLLERGLGVEELPAARAEEVTWFTAVGATIENLLVHTGVLWHVNVQHVILQYVLALAFRGTVMAEEEARLLAVIPVVLQSLRVVEQLVALLAAHLCKISNRQYIRVNKR